MYYLLLLTSFFVHGNIGNNNAYMCVAGACIRTCVQVCEWVHVCMSRSMARVVIFDSFVSNHLLSSTVGI